ncbi:3-coathanger stack domain-containing protein [Emticicia sp. BO119]
MTASNKLTGTANVTYRSNKSVQLNQGFKAESGTVFKAEIGGCN